MLLALILLLLLIAAFFYPPDPPQGPRSSMPFFPIFAAFPLFGNDPMPNIFQMGRAPLRGNWRKPKPVRKNHKPKRRK